MQRSFNGRLLVVFSAALLASCEPDSAAELGITSFAPTSGPEGTSVLVLGQGFSSRAGDDLVTLGGLAVSVTSASPTALTFTVPAGATSGRVGVASLGRVATSASDFTVVSELEVTAPTAPTITGFTPTSGPAGTSVTISGAHFAPTSGANLVAFHGTAATVTAASANSITVTVPAEATTGRLSVTVAGATATSASDFTVTAQVSEPAALFVSPSGSASAPGTASAPTTLAAALTKVAPGGTIVMLGGTYAFSTQVTIEAVNSGASGSPKRLFAASGARPVLDFSSQPYGSTSSVNNPRGLQLNGSWWHVRGLEVKGAADNGLFIAGSHNIVEGCTFHGNRDSGLQLGRASSSTARADWPAYNLVLNCESFDNYDSPPNGGENADGFACKLTTGPGNVFRGCVAHHNIDDGWDLYTKSDTGAIDPVVIDQCVAFKNGTLTDGTSNPNGDRNGFKLGGEKIAVSHVITRSIAAANGKNGFTFNSNPGAIRVVNNLAWDNAEGNFKFDGPDVSQAIFINNLSLWTSATQVSDRAGAASGAVIAANGFWDKTKKSLWGFAGSGTFSSGDLKSTALPTTFPLSRDADGALALGDAGKLAAGSKLIDLGVLPSLPSEAGVPGLPYDPASAYIGAPDPGALEVR